MSAHPSPETSSSARALRAMTPREHGLWSWVGLPLLGAILLAPGAASALGAGAVLAGFGACNAARRGETRAAAGALAVGAALGGAALLTAPDPWAFATASAVGGAGALAALHATRRLHAIGVELASILALAMLGAALAVSAGAASDAAIMMAAVVGTWHALGLWWVRAQMARLLPGRQAWAGGPATGAALILATLALAAQTSLWAAGLIPLLYPLRIALHRPPTAPREARRVGLTELGWATVALVLAVKAGA